MASKNPIPTLNPTTVPRLSSADINYYNQQLRNVYDMQAVGQQENANARAGADMTFQQKLQALGERLDQQQAALPDRFAARGIQNSGVYNFGGGNPEYSGAVGTGWSSAPQTHGGQFGALQQFQFDRTNALGDLRAQQGNVDQGYNARLNDLNTQATDQEGSINQTAVAQSAAQAQADAVASGGM